MSEKSNISGMGIWAFDGRDIGYDSSTIYLRFYSNAPVISYFK